MDYVLPACLWRPGVKLPGFFKKLRESVRQLTFLVVRARSYDIAHFHGLGWGTLVSALLLGSFGKRAVFTSSLQGSDNPSAIAGIRGGRWATKLMRHFDGIVALSPALAEDFVAHHHKNVVCLPNFLALPQLERGRDDDARGKLRAAYRIPTDAKVLLFIGAAIQRKGVELLVESYCRLASRHRSLWLVVVGPQSKVEDPDIDEAFVDSLRVLIAGTEAASRVVWVGMVRDKGVVAQYYSAADVFVFPTRAEGLGNVLIEAAAAGLPAVATNLPGVTDSVVTEGETGFLFPPEDVDALTQATERLVTDPDLRARMGLAARAQSKRFGFEDYCRHLKAFYLKTAGLAR
jgi:glycosyltransferase involved in cell wall biosynthesis